MKTNLVLADKIKEKSVEGCVHTFSVELDKKQVEDTCQSAIVRLQSVVSLPGFRTGKVPLSMIKAQFPSMVRDEAVEISAKAALPEIFKMSKLNPVVQP